ncbi:hypothetical protein MLD38_017115 [Melastoma candidum]|uniref:Uncharacterized protein n=1 Tax=Melastoma candidum TaxID=119954 RepID=A0ACB9QXU0_9MYRT|nr:hypothetical protein MLD38_017115 [Melastoma candidum]
MAVLCGPTGNKFLFSNEGKKVALWWPASVTALMGPSLITKSGEEGRVEKKAFAGFFSPDTLMRCVATMDEVTRGHLLSRWAGTHQT